MNDYRKEMEAPPAVPGTAVPQEVLVPTNEALIRKSTAAAGWLWWVAGASVVNIVLTHIDSPLRFSLGLCVTDVVYAVGHASGVALTYAALLLDLLLLGFVVFLGFQAKQAKVWAFITGVSIVGVDAVVLAWLLLKFSSFSMVGCLVHVLAIVYLCAGIGAAKTYNLRKAQGKA